MQRFNNDNEIAAGKPLMNLLARIISHVTVALSCAMVALFIIDLIWKGEMSLLANSITKWMLFALCALSLANALLHLKSLYRLRCIRKYARLVSKKR